MRLSTIFVSSAFVLAGMGIALPVKRENMLVARFAANSNLLSGVEAVEVRAYNEEPELDARGGAVSANNYNPRRRSNEQPGDGLTRRADDLKNHQSGFNLPPFPLLNSLNIKSRPPPPQGPRPLSSQSQPPVPNPPQLPVPNHPQPVPNHPQPPVPNHPQLPVPNHPQLPVPNHPQFSVPNHPQPPVSNHPQLKTPRPLPKPPTLKTTNSMTDSGRPSISPIYTGPLIPNRRPPSPVTVPPSTSNDPQPPRKAFQRFKESVSNLFNKSRNRRSFYDSSIDSFVY